MTSLNHHFYLIDHPDLTINLSLFVIDIINLDFKLLLDSDLYTMIGLTLLSSWKKENTDVSVDFGLVRALNNLNLTNRRNKLSDQMFGCESAFPGLGDLNWSKTRLAEEANKYKRNGALACKNIVSDNRGAVAETFAESNHEGLGKFKSLDDFSVLSRFLRNCHSSMSTHMERGGDYCWMNTGKLNCVKQVLRCASLCFRLIDDDAKIDWLQKIMSGHLLCALNLDDFIEQGKKLTVLSKKGLYKYSKVWFALIDVHTWSGFNVGVKLNDVVDDELDGWIGGEKWVEGVPEPWWSEGQFRMMKELFRPTDSGRIRAANQKSVDFKGWVMNTDNWVTSGASGVKGRVINEQGESVKTKGNKSNVALQYSVDEIIAFVDEDRSEIPLNPALKVELGWKNRLIIRVDDFVNINASYGGRMVMNLLKGNRYSSLFMDSHQQYNMWVNWCKLLSNERIIAYPYDAPSFDQKLQTNELRCYFKWRAWMLENFVLDNRLEYVLRSKLAERQYFSQFGYVGDRKVMLQHGMVSGYFDTSLGDSVISVSRNSLLLRCADKVLGMQELFIGGSVGQGDDFCTVSSSLCKIGLHFDWVNKCGWGAHPEKNFINVGFTEYLRKYLDVKNKLVSGYLSRKMGGLLFRDPIRRGGAVGISGLRERVGALNVCLTRRGNKAECLRLIDKTMRSVLLHGHTYLSRDVAFNVSSTPAAMGGGGVWLPGVNRNARWYRMEQVIDEVELAEAPKITGVFAEGVKVLFDAMGSDFHLGALRTQLLTQVIDKSQIKDRWSVVEVRKMQTAHVVRGIGKMDMAPARRDVVPMWHSEVMYLRSGVQDAIVFALQHKAINKLEGLVSHSGLLLLKYLDTRWKRSTVIDWVKGSLRPKTALVVGCSPIETTIISNMVSSHYWSELINKRHITANDIITVNLNVEISVVTALRHSVLPIRYSD